MATAGLCIPIHITEQVLYLTELCRKYFQKFKPPTKSHNHLALRLSDGKKPIERLSLKLVELYKVIPRFSSAPPSRNKG